MEISTPAKRPRGTEDDDDDAVLNADEFVIQEPLADDMLVESDEGEDGGGAASGPEPDGVFPALPSSALGANSPLCKEPRSSRKKPANIVWTKIKRIKDKDHREKLGENS